MNQFDTHFLFCDGRPTSTPGNRRILVADDDPNSRRAFERLLAPETMPEDSATPDLNAFFGESAQPVSAAANEYSLTFASQGQEAIDLCQSARESENPFAVAFVDKRMPPGIDGFETIRRLWAIDPHLQIVLCTADHDDLIREELNQLQATEQLLVLKKPFEPLELLSMAEVLVKKWNWIKQARTVVEEQNRKIENAQQFLASLEASHRELETECQTLQRTTEFLRERLRKQAIELIGTREITFLALAQLAESRDPETGEHIYRMRAFSQLLAEELSESPEYRNVIDQQFLDHLWLSSPLHDIGKVAIPDQILLKPGKLTESEFEIMKQHTNLGADVLASASRKNGFGQFLTMAIEIARHHHEWFDGTGYPDGLKGDQIPLAARIVAVADVFDALTMKRCYKDAMSPDRARSIIESESGTHFDPVVVRAFTTRYEDFLRIKSRIDEMGVADTFDTGFSFARLDTSELDAAANPAPATDG